MSDYWHSVLEVLPIALPVAIVYRLPRSLLGGE